MCWKVNNYFCQLRKIYFARFMSHVGSLKLFITLTLLVPMGWWVWAMTARYGPGINADSVHYMTAARNLAERCALVTYTGAPLVSFPPLLPAIYALGYILSGNVELVARVICLLVAMLTMFVGGIWLSRVSKGPLVVIGALALLLTPPFLSFSPYAISDSPFVALVLIALWNALRFAETGEIRYLRQACFWSALCPMMRYIGISVLITVFLFFLTNLRQSLGARIRIASTYTVFSILPFVIWLARNKWASGTLMGIRESSDYLWAEILWDSFWVWHGWFVTISFKKSATLLTAAILLIVALYVSLLWSVRKKSFHDYAQLVILGLFTLVYSVMLVYAASTVRFYPLAGRFWLPVSIPSVLILISMASKLDAISGYSKHFGKVATILLIVGWIGSGASYVRQTLLEGHENILWSFNAPMWRSSETAGFLRRHKVDGLLFSDSPVHLYYLTGHLAQWLPHKGALRVAGEELPNTLDSFLEKLKDASRRGEPAYAVWLWRAKHEYVFSLEELGRYTDIAVHRSFSDGIIVRLLPAGQTSGVREWKTKHVHP